jgi:hypothetical protein
MSSSTRSFAVLVLIAGVIAGSCSLLAHRTTADGQPPRAHRHPTSAQVPPDTDVITGELRLDGPCLYLQGRGGDDVLPIWPSGFNALAGPGFLGLRNGPNDEKVFAVGSEILELHGLRVETPPADARVPAACAKYQLFHVGEALNRS